jgi:hypothetical protein
MLPSTPVSAEGGGEPTTVRPRMTSGACLHPHRSKSAIIPRIREVHARRLEREAAMLHMMGWVGAGSAVPHPGKAEWPCSLATEPGSACQSVVASALASLRPPPGQLAAVPGDSSWVRPRVWRFTLMRRGKSRLRLSRREGSGRKAPPGSSYPGGGPVAIVTDPVCGMRIDPDDAAATAEHEGTTTTSARRPATMPS